MHTGKIAATAAAVAIAALIGQISPASAAGSDQNMLFASRYLQRAADALQRDSRDYGGHRAKAVTDIDRARNNIESALQYDSSHERLAAPLTGAAADAAAMQLPQVGSDQSLSAVKVNLERAIDMLNRDQADFGGYRVKAIQELQAARGQLNLAIAYDKNTDHTGQASDNNLRFTRAYVERGIDMLQHDQATYNGHRTAAILAMRRADADLLAALRADHADESVPAVQALARPTDMVRGQNASDTNVRYVRAYVEHAIDMLTNDRHDYSGYRVKAIAELQDARGQLLAALRYR